VLIVPLRARDRALGAVTMLRTGDAPPFDASDVALAEELAQRAGVAVDNSLLHRAARNVALELQRAVLPGDLAGETGWQLATYYQPGGTADVGGDFYDALGFGPGRLAVVIGDVMGHGVSAAAAMAQMRAAVRAYACIDPEPDLVLEKLDAMFLRLDIGRLATLAYLLVDMPAHEVRMCNAGHYPPLIIRGSGASEYTESAPERPLGAGGDRRVVTRWPVAAGDVLLLYTDGLVERRGESIDTGLARLRDAAVLLRQEPLDDALSRLVERVGTTDPDDDVTALAVSIPPPA
jgi:serine phosphatase RsbU (regulator of sigma subunit)